jgi:hypothetical protein
MGRRGPVDPRIDNARNAVGFAGGQRLPSLRRRPTPPLPRKREREQTEFAARPERDERRQALDLWGAHVGGRADATFAPLHERPDALFVGSSSFFKARRVPRRRGEARDARPDGNLTGINWFASELAAKRLELLRESGSSGELKTMGTVVVAVLAANAAEVVPATITATCRRTSSAASAGSRSI